MKPTLTPVLLFAMTGLVMPIILREDPVWYALAICAAAGAIIGYSLIRLPGDRK